MKSNSLTALLTYANFGHKYKTTVRASGINQISLILASTNHQPPFNSKSISPAPWVAVPNLVGGASSAPPLVSEVLLGERCQRSQDDVEYNVICHIFINNHNYSQHIFTKTHQKRTLDKHKPKNCHHNHGYDGTRTPSSIGRDHLLERGGG